MVRGGYLTEVDPVEVEECRRSQNRPGFAFQVGFIRLLTGDPERPVRQM
jgi:hypothetical protein